MKNFKNLLKWNVLDFILLIFIVSGFIGSLLTKKDMTGFMFILFVGYATGNLINKFPMQKFFQEYAYRENWANQYIPKSSKIIQWLIYIGIAVTIFFAAKELIIN